MTERLLRQDDKQNVKLADSIVFRLALIHLVGLGSAKFNFPSIV